MPSDNKIFRFRYFPSFFASVFFVIFFLLLQPVEAATVQFVSGWTLAGKNQAVEKYQKTDPDLLAGKDTLELTYNLHGLCLLPGDASALIFDQPAGGQWHYVSLSRYGKNCYDGVQTAAIPLKDFAGLNPASPVGLFHARIWSPGSFTVDIVSAGVYSASALPTASPVQPTASSAPSIPAPTSLPPAAPGYRGEYFANQSLNGMPAMTRTDNAINFAWNNGSPDAGIPADHFSVRWSRSVDFAAGSYTFTVSADDGFRLFIDNKPVIDKWIDQAVTTYKTTVSLTGGVHAVRLEYYEDAGGAIAKMDYAPAGTAPSPVPSPTAVPAPVLPTPTPVPVATAAAWQIKSVSSMKETKDKVCGQDDASFINKWLDKAAELGVNYVAVETPYDNPGCGNSVAYTKAWVDAVRAHGLKVWHRHMPLSFEGIYSVAKTPGNNYLSQISSYIRANPSLFAPGDIFTPIPEPQNGGISGVTYCASNVCQFQTKEQFNQWLRDAIDTSNTAFQSIGLGGQMKVGYYGFDGFVAWGDNNPDWHGILEDATVAKMGNITIDHYPELVGETMEQSLAQLHAKYPNTPVVIGEWGSVGTSDPVGQVASSMGAAKNASYVVGFNYWHLGMGGNEALINSDFTNRPQFASVAAYFK